jgi:hypothetical protein
MLVDAAIRITSPSGLPPTRGVWPPSPATALPAIGGVDRGEGHDADPAAFARDAIAVEDRCMLSILATIAAS